MDFFSFGDWTSEEVLTPIRKPMVVLAPGPVPGPRQYHGPFTLFVLPVTEYVGDATGMVKVCLSFIGVPPTVRRLWMATEDGTGTDGVGEAFKLGLHEFADTAGEHADLSGTNPHEGYPDSPPIMPMTSAVKVPLVRLLRDVREVRLAGKAVAWLPEAIETIRIEAPVTRPRRVEGTDAAATIFPDPADEEAPDPPVAVVAEAADEEAPVRARFDPYPFALAIDLEMPAGALAWAVGVNEAGEPIGLTSLRGRNVAGPPPQPVRPGNVVLRSQFIAARAPATIIVKILRSTRRMELPFELSIPLARHASQPVAMEPLTMEGDAPLSFTVDTDLFGSPYYRLENRTNKGIVRVSYALKDEHMAGFSFRHWGLKQDLYGVQGYDTGAGILLTPGATRKWPPDFFFRHNPRKDIDVLKVEFADGSAWVDPEWEVEEAKRAEMMRP